MSSQARAPSKFESDPEWAHLVNLIWVHQEIKHLGSIPEEDLFILSGWSRAKFAEVRDRLLEDPESGVYRPSLGFLAYRW